MQEAQGLTSPDIFARAVDCFSHVQGIDQLQVAIVPEEYFQRRSSAQQSSTNTPVKTKLSKKRSQPLSRKRSRGLDSDDESMTEDGEDGSYMEDCDDLAPGQRYASRTSSRATTTQGAALQRRTSQSSLPPLPPPHHQALGGSMGMGGMAPSHHFGLPDVFHGMFHGDASATIKITGRPPKASAAQQPPMLPGGMQMMYHGMMHPGYPPLPPQQQMRAGMPPFGMYPAPHQPHHQPAAPPPVAPAPAPASCSADWQQDMGSMFGSGPDDIDGEHLLFSAGAQLLPTHTSLLSVSHACMSCIPPPFGPPPPPTPLPQASRMPTSPSCGRLWTRRTSRRGRRQPLASRRSPKW